MIAGQKLREFREAQRVRPADAAKAMQVERQRIPQIEGAEEVGSDVAGRYLAAVCVAAGIVQYPDQVELQVALFANGEEIERW